jgi:hypothetical protein
VHIGEGRRTDDLAAAELAVIEVHRHPLRHILDARVDRARWTDRRDGAEGDLLSLLVAFVIGLGEVVRLLRVEDRKVRARHPERVEDALSHVVLPALSRDVLGEVSGGQEHQVVVLPLRAERFVRLEVRKALDDLPARDPEVVVPEQIVAGQSRTVCDEVARRDHVRRRLIVHAEARKEGADGLVPVELALVDERAEDEGRESLRAGSDREERLRGDGKLPLHVAHAETLRVDDLAAFDHRDRESGHLPVGDGLLDERVEPGERVLRGGGLRRGARELERERLAPLREVARDLRAVGGELALEGRIAGDAWDREGDRVGVLRDVGEREILGVLRRDRDVANPRAIVFLREVDVDRESRSRYVDRAFPVARDRRRLGGRGSGQGEYQAKDETQHPRAGLHGMGLLSRGNSARL